MNLEQALTEYRRCGLAKQTIIHDACHSCLLYTPIVMDSTAKEWTLCDLFSEAETPKDLLAEARTRYGSRSEAKRRLYLFNRGCA